MSHVVSEYKLWQLVSSSSFSVTKGLGNPLFAGTELHSQREEVGKTVVGNSSHLKRFLNTFPFIYYLSCSTSFLWEALGLLFHLPTPTAHMKPGRDQSPTSTEGHAKTLCLNNTEKWKKRFQQFWESIYAEQELRNPVSANAPVTRSRLQL